MRLPLAAGLLVLAGCLGSGPDGGATSGPGPADGGHPAGSGVRLDLVADGFTAPLYVLDAPGDPDRLYVLERAGRVLAVANGTAQEEPYLDLTDRVGSGGSEQGLLGLAFHPGFAQNGAAIVSYTDLAGDSVLSRFRRDAGGLRLDPASEEILLQVDQPFENHNGGHALYGPDGYLYFGLGDGGLAGDPFANARNRMTLLGDLLRLDVGPEGPYAVPPDNPFAGDPSARGEIWASGLRNPWRFHFDRETGDLWIGDVGQDRFEEVDFQPAGEGGQDYGWNLFEGSHHWPSMAAAPLAVPGITFPVAEYDHGDGRCSVTQGPVYRGSAVPSLRGATLYADFCTGTVWRLDGPQGTPEVLLEAGFPVSSFGEDAAGEAYLVDYGAGRILRLAAA